jgi:YHS domain-containing protein
MIAFGVLVLAVGCATNAERTATPDAPTTPAAAPAAAEPAGPPAFVNDEGRLACPVMGDVVASPDRSAGHVDYKGKRYYFCCNSCDQLFNEDPEKYADGRHLQEIGKMRGGTSDAPACELPPAEGAAPTAPAG